MKRLYKTTREDRRLLRDIAEYYGCRVHFTNGFGSYFTGKSILLGQPRDFKDLVSSFCHELSHYIQSQTGKFPIYYNRKRGNYRQDMMKFGGVRGFAAYALRAELYTDKVGKKLCKEWFHGVKYQGGYRNTVACREFLVGFYIRGA